MGQIIERSAKILEVEIHSDATVEIARRSRGTPRICNSLLRRVRDFAQIKGNGKIDLEIAQFALNALNVDQHGLDEMDNRILSTIIDKFKWGPCRADYNFNSGWRGGWNHRRGLRTLFNHARFYGSNPQR